LDKTFAPETVRLYLEQLGGDDENILKSLDECNLRLLRKAAITGIKVNGEKLVPVDVDTSPMDNSGTKKENIGYTYKGFSGYHPLFAYIGIEGYMMKNEMRPGSQHCQKGTPAFLTELCDELPQVIGNKKALFRLDSGNDAMETMRAILRDGRGEKRGHNVIIKRNMRLEYPEWWLGTGKLYGKQEELRPGKTRYTGKVTYPCSMTEAFPELSVVFEVTERTADAAGNIELIPVIDVNLWWTNLECEAEEIIQRYHEHGTMEQFHSELKTDMGVERFPSGKYSVNRILLSVAMCAFNILRFIGQTMLVHRELLPEKTECLRKRIGKVILEIIHMACKVVHHSRQFIVEIWEGHPWTPVFDALYTSFELL
jgi:hypothetical protein